MSEYKVLCLGDVVGITAVEKLCRELPSLIKENALNCVIINGENSDIIVAERSGVICGMVCVDYVNKPETPYSKARNFYHVQEIAVDVNHRRQGVAKELLEFMIADAKKRNLGKIELDVWEFNDSAIEFYQAVGFRQTRRWMEYEIE